VTRRREVVPWRECAKPCLLIERIRRDLGLTQADFAERLGVERVTVSLWERGRQRTMPRSWERVRAFVAAAKGADSGALLEIDDVTTRDWRRH
jgi:transcriptional regulator with XRE-family HTH domain